MSRDSAGAARAERLADPDAEVIRTSVGALLREQAAAHGARDALLWREGETLQRLTYAELLAVAERYARWIRQYAEPGEVVAIWSRNRPDWVFAEYGCALAGTPIASFNAAWTDREIQHAVELTTPTIVLAGADSRGAALLDRARATIPGARVEPLEAPKTLDTGPTRPLPEVAPDSPFLIQFTSGTTGRSKGALLSHRAALNAAALRASLQGATPDDVFLNGTPLHHVAGSISLVLGTLVAGAAYVLVERVSPDLMLTLLKTSGATRFGGVPTVLKEVIEHPEFPSGGLPLVSIGAGGADVPEALIHQLTAAFHGPVSVGYGQSECPLASNSLRSDSAQLIATTVGWVPPQNGVRIIDPTTGRVLQLGEIGEVCVHSPATMTGYFRNPKATAEVLDSEGWLRTGDLGSLDADGYLRLNGRSRDVIIRGGVNIYPAEIEHTLMEHPAVLGAASVGIPDTRLGQRVAAVVMLREGASATASDLEAFLGERITHYKVPRDWRFVDALPMTASGKIRKVDLPDLFKA